MAKTLRWLLALSVSCLLVALAGCGQGGGSSDTPTGSKTLAIAPLHQELPAWCWAASASMVFKYYRMPQVDANDYQCGVVATIFPQCTCRQCAATIGPMDRMQYVLYYYGYSLYTDGYLGRILSSSIAPNALTFDQVQREIDADRPVMAAISPSGFASQDVAGHVAVIVGYNTNGAVPPRLIVNDPYPYAAPAFGGQPDPYLLAGGQMIEPGQYSVPYGEFVNQLHWGSTLYEIQ